MNKAISFDDIETERQRGDTYRARALALLRSARYNKYWKRHWKMMVLGMAGKLGAETGLRTACDFLNSQLAAERQAREDAEARAAGLAEVLRGIQGMAAEELRTEELRPSTLMWQIEADARAALANVSAA